MEPVKYLLSAFYVFTWAFFFSFVAMGFTMILLASVDDKLWIVWLHTSLGFGVVSGVTQVLIHGRPTSDGEAFNPWNMHLK